MKPFLVAGRYVNYLDADEAENAVALAYGPNYGRLRQVKTRYDPTNFFHLNQNIRRNRLRVVRNFLLFHHRDHRFLLFFARSVI